MTGLIKLDCIILQNLLFKIKLLMTEVNNVNICETQVTQAIVLMVKRVNNLGDSPSTLQMVSIGIDG